MAFNQEEEAKLAEDARRIAAIADETLRDAALTQAARSSTSPAEAFDHLNAALKAAEEEAKATGKHTLSAVVETFNTSPRVIRSEFSAGFDPQGFTGAGASVATGLFDGKTFGEGNDVGAASAVLSGGVNKQGALGDPGVALRYVSPTLINDKDSAFESVAIGVVGANAPTDGREFTGKDVPLAVGDVLIHKDSGAALTTVLGTDATFKSVDAFGRISGNVWEDDKTRVDLNVHGGYNTGTQEGRAGAGVFVDHKLDSTTTVYAGLNAEINDVGGKNALGGGAFIGATFDVMPEVKPAMPTNSIQNLEFPPIVSSATTVQADEGLFKNKGVESFYSIKEYDLASQEKIKGFMKDTFVKAGYTDAEAPLAVEAALKKSHGYVSNRGTETHLDDIPEAPEMVAGK